MGQTPPLGPVGSVLPRAATRRLPSLGQNAASGGYSSRQVGHTLPNGASLLGVIAQRLLTRVDGGRVAAFEVLLSTPAVRNLIREGKTEQLRNVMVTGQRSGMHTLEASLRVLVEQGVITAEVAAASSAHPAELTGRL